VLVMANHGIATIGRSVAEAYDLLYYMERVAQVQLYAMWTNRPLRALPKSVLEETATAFKQKMPKYGGKPSCEWHFEALKRLLEREQPDYKN